MRNTGTFTIQNIDTLRLQLQFWANRFNEVFYYDSCNKNQHPNLHSRFDILIGANALKTVPFISGQVFNQLSDFHEMEKDWFFGYFSYDLKNETEDLQSRNPYQLYFPNSQFMVPEMVVSLVKNTLKIEVHSQSALRPKDLYHEILSTETKLQANQHSIGFTERVQKEKYISRVKQLKNHIQRGDIYEANYCVEFYAQNQQINPLHVYQKLARVSPTPFSAYVKLHRHYLMSASPERYLFKENKRIISQPIKGTMRRGNTTDEDRQLKEQLQNDQKERAENIMIVDLVRNDLSRTAAKGSVNVTELCGIYSYRQVHQMISTIESELESGYSMADVFKTTFPMGSMTGAPKIRAMEIIEELEESKRGLYSGSVGYITPEGNFDFNVVIRSLQYNGDNKYLSFMVGSAITSKSVPEKEYEECLLKAQAMKKALE